MRIVIQFHPKAPESFETSSKLHSYFILPFETPLTFKNDKGYYRFCKSWGSFCLPKLQRDAGGLRRERSRTHPGAPTRNPLITPAIWQTKVQQWVAVQKGDRDGIAWLQCPPGRISDFVKFLFIFRLHSHPVYCIIKKGLFKWKWVVPFQNLK